MSKIKRVLAALLAVMLLISLAPAALAEGEDETVLPGGEAAAAVEGTNEGGEDEAEGEPALPEEWEAGDTLTVEEVEAMKSLLPLEKVQLSLDLSTYAVPELRMIPIRTLLTGMNGLTDDTMVAWALDGDDDYKVSSINDRIDIADAYSRFNCIVGSGKQLDSSNKYVEVRLTMPSIYKWIIPTLYVQAEDGTRKELNVIRSNYFNNLRVASFNESSRSTSVTISDTIQVRPGDGNHTISAEFHTGDPIYIYGNLNMGYEKQDINGEVYLGLKFGDSVVPNDRFDSVKILALKGSEFVDVTNSAWNVDMSASNSGIDSNSTIIRIELRKGDTLVGFDCFDYGSYTSSNGLSVGWPYAKDGDYNHKQVAYNVSGKTENGVITWTSTLYKEYPASGSYYQRLYYYVNDETDNSAVDMAVVGLYDSKDAAVAAGAADIKDQLFGNDGYLACYGGDGVSFTVFSGDKVSKICVKAVDGTESKDDDQPYGADNYFNIDGAADWNYNQYYVVPYEHDAYFYNGFQTVLVLDPNADLSAVHPTFNSPKKATIYGGAASEVQKSGVTAQNFANGPVHYSVSAEDGANRDRDYQVTFVKKDTSGPKLFVNAINGVQGAKREILLNNYQGWKHDVFIANVGSEPLTGLKVEIRDAKNIKLDDYWTVGGNGNDTLAAFTTASEDYSGSGELPNVAKIRLLPTDANGEISGTLVISADGQQTVEIELTGMAGNPTILTDTLRDGVKYVPYGLMLQTSNMYEWNKVSFSLSEDSKLPDGMILKENGEIYGVPKETGEFKIKVTMYNSSSYFSDVTKEYTLKILENTDANVDASVDAGYEIQIRVPDMVTYADQVFEIKGVLPEFIDFWLDGEKMTSGEDYMAEEGSTKITILARTFANAGSGSHTIAAEFRVNGDINKDLKKAAQNYYSGGGGGRPIDPTDSSGAGFVNTLDGISVGDVVEYTKNFHFYTSTSTSPISCYPGKAKVVAIYPAGLHPYCLVSLGGSANVCGWVDKSGIAAEGTFVSSGISKGDTVRVNAGARTYEGIRLASFVYKNTFTVLDIYNDRVIIGQGKAVTAAVNVKDLTLAG